MSETTNEIQETIDVSLNRVTFKPMNSPTLERALRLTVPNILTLYQTSGLKKLTLTIQALWWSALVRWLFEESRKENPLDAQHDKIDCFVKFFTRFFELDGLLSSVIEAEEASKSEEDRRYRRDVHGPADDKVVFTLTDPTALKALLVEHAGFPEDTSVQSSRDCLLYLLGVPLTEEPLEYELPPMLTDALINAVLNRGSGPDDFTTEPTEVFFSYRPNDRKIAGFIEKGLTHRDYEVTFGPRVVADEVSFGASIAFREEKPLGTQTIESRCCWESEFLVYDLEKIVIDLGEASEHDDARYSFLTPDHRDLFDFLVNPEKLGNLLN